MNPSRNVEIVGRHLELTDAIVARTNEVLEKLYEHDSGIERIRIELGMETHSKTHENEFVAKGHLVDRRDTFIASAAANDLYAAISTLGDKLDKLIRRKSRRRLAIRRKPAPIDIESDLPKVSGDAA